MGLKHRIPHVAALACALPFFVVAVAMAADDSGPDGGAAELREGAFRVRFRDCPTCEMRMRVSPEASIAFVNTSRVGAADRPAVAARAFAVKRKMQSSTSFLATCIKSASSSTIMTILGSFLSLALRLAL